MFSYFDATFEWNLIKIIWADCEKIVILCFFLMAATLIFWVIKKMIKSFQDLIKTAHIPNWIKVGPFDSAVDGCTVTDIIPKTFRLKMLKFAHKNTKQIYIDFLTNHISFSILHIYVVKNLCSFNYPYYRTIYVFLLPFFLIAIHLTLIL